jgi:hypothetical protein
VILQIDGPFHLSFRPPSAVIPEMRTPSLYSQDDPISAALKPSPTETEAERSVRLVREADAKQVSEQIDEDIRLERERLKRRKGDVKVCRELHSTSPTHIVTFILPV